jgi:hypothetical protein
VTDAYPSGDMCFREVEVGRMTTDLVDDVGIFVTFSMQGGLDSDGAQGARLPGHPRHHRRIEHPLPPDVPDREGEGRNRPADDDGRSRYPTDIVGLRQSHR